VSDKKVFSNPAKLNNHGNGRQNLHNPATATDPAPVNRRDVASRSVALNKKMTGVGAISQPITRSRNRVPKLSE
jgi:hypothetical protein